MKTIAHLPPENPRMIDLTRSLKLPHGSLSPNTDPEPSFSETDCRRQPAGQGREPPCQPRWRIEARLDADHFSRAAVCLLIAFILIAHALFFFFAR